MSKITTIVDSIISKVNNCAKLNDDQTIDGVKTFTSSPIVPTPIAGNNSTKVATTAFVNSEVGVTNSPLVKTALNATGNAPIYACRAWVNFNGTGTVAIRANGNVSSITDNGVGDYTINFTTAMSDANYSGVATSGYGSGSRTAIRTPSISDQFTTSFRFNVSSSNGVNEDVVWNNVSIFR